jgi:prepilin-type N-terminal cleavage/methylation domain-containing protein
VISLAPANYCHTFFYVSKLLIARIFGCFPRRELTMLNRTRRAFTLLELMVAFIIMAILSAVAIPSLIGIVAGNQASADATSAISVADAAYYSNVSNGTSTAPVASGSITSVTAGATSGDYLFTFANDDVCVLVPTSAGGSPTQVGVTATSANFWGGVSGTPGTQAAPLFTASHTAC